MSKRKKQSQKILVSIAQILGTGALICTILLLFLLSLPRFIGYETYNVISCSMEPEIPVGSLILVKEIDPYDLVSGDIIAFDDNGSVICHRVVVNNVFEKKITTKGDANPIEDPKTLLYENVIGLVTFHVSDLGMIGAYFSTLSGKLVLVEIMIIGILLRVVADKVKL